MRERKNQIMLLLENMGSTHNEIVRRATEELQEECDDADSTVFICSVMRSNEIVKMRQNAANILALRLAEAPVWQQLSEQQSATIMTELFESLKSLENDGNELLQRSVLRNLGLAMSQERGSWTEAVFDYIEAICLSVDVTRRHLGSIIYSLLADASPEVFVHQMERAQRIFLDGLHLANVEGCLVTPITDRLLSGWIRALVVGHNHFRTGETLSSSMPLVMRLFQLCPYQPNEVKCVRGFEMLRTLHEYKPLFLWKHLGMILEVLLILVSDINLPMPMRVKALRMLGKIVMEKLSDTAKLQMLDDVLMALHRLLAVEPALDAEGEEDYLGLCLEGPSILAAGVETVKQLATKSNGNRLAARCLKLFNAHLDTKPKPVQRLGVYVFFGVMSEGFTDQLKIKHLKRIFELIKNGFKDEEPVVSRAAYFSLSMIVEHLLPEIAQLADRLMTIYYDYFEQVLDSCRATSSGSHLDSRLFYSLELLLQGLRPSIVERYVPDLMSRLLQLLQPEVDSKFARQMALSGISGVCDAVGAAMEPHFNTVVDATQPCLILNGEDDLQLRAQAIRVFAVLARVSREKFTNLAPMLLTFDVSVLEENRSPESFTFELMTELCAVIPDQCKPHVKLIVEAVFKTLKRLQEDPEPDEEQENVESLENRGNLVDVPVHEFDNVNYDEIFGEEESSTQDDDETEDDMDDDRSVDSSDFDLSDAREEAILCLRSLAIHLPESFEPFMKEVIRRLVECLDLDKEYVSKAAFETLTQCVLILWKKESYGEAKRLCTKIIGKAILHMADSGETKVVIAEIECIRILLTALEYRALEKVSQGPKIFTVLRNVLRRNMECQVNENWNCYDDMENIRPNDPRYWCESYHKEEKLVEKAIATLPILCKAMGPRRFTQQLEPLARTSWFSRGGYEKECYFCGVLIKCLDVMEYAADPYYELICSSISKNLRNRYELVRQRSFKSLGDIVDLLDRKPDNILTIAQPLVGVLRDNRRLIGMERQSALKAMCKMMIFDQNKCPVQDFLDLIFNDNPFLALEDLQAQFSLFVSALNILIDVKNEAVQLFISEILEMFLNLVDRDQLGTEENLQKAKNLVGAIKEAHPEEFNAVALKCESAVAQLFP
ncbi:uncharacterized protein Dana_GF22457 [Drosophila ananassae]|uniref:Importin N-terminal domain-containing protein n=1 Tax=Drosophila ananassae TaxID=7217 RepID=B3MWF4_DROAN|nr:importin-4 [Drosophila ananassae]EDV34939.1 uncharacterized protein Dana_GF22457 [Drosophila ananassae]